MMLNAGQVKTRWLPSCTSPLSHRVQMAVSALPMRWIEGALVRTAVCVGASGSI